MSSVSIGAYAAVLSSLGMDKDFEFIASDEEQKQRYLESGLVLRKRATRSLKECKEGE